MGLIAAFDPGGTTGIALIDHTAGRDFELVKSFELPWSNRFEIFNLIYVNRSKIKAIVIEKFQLFENQITLHAQINSEMPSSQVIGIIELSAKISKLDCVYFQRPADIHYRDPKTKRLEYTILIPDHFKGKLHKSQHCVDAFLHARFFVLTVARKQPI